MGTATFGRANPTLAVWNRRRSGAWRAAPSAVTGWSWPLAVADLDGDGADEVLGGTDANVVAVAGYRRGALQPPEPLFDEPGAFQPPQVAVADLDGDGDPDVAQLARSGGPPDFWYYGYPSDQEVAERSSV